MPDISMCAHAECPSRKSCYRHADERPSDNTRHATSPGVTAGASAVEDDLCGRLRVYALAEDIMSSERRDLETAATRILSLSAQLAEARREGDLYRQQIGKAVARATAAESEAAALRERVGELTKAEERAVIAAITAVFPLEAMNIVGLSNMRLSDKMKDGVRAGIEAVRELRRARTALEGRE